MCYCFEIKIFANILKTYNGIYLNKNTFLTIIIIIINNNVNYTQIKIINSVSE